MSVQKVTYAILLASAVSAAHAEPTDPAGNTGATNYVTLPFVSSIYNACWNCSPNLEPAQLFFQANPNSVFNNANTMATVRQSAASQEAAGIVPSGGAQRWEDTYAASFPAGTFPGEPSWVQSDRNQGFPNMPDFVAWRQFIASHPQYWDVAYDGGTAPTYYRPWGGQWGHISPITPLDQADCPPGMTNGCTWGDFWAYRWSLTTALTGAYGLMLSDFSDSQPNEPSTFQDFNPRLIAKFAAQQKLTVPSGSVSAQANWIVANAYTQWNDFLARGYARFYHALANRIGAATNRVALIADQCSDPPGWRRLVGTDARILAHIMDLRTYTCIWDGHVIMTSRAGPIAQPPLRELAGAVIAAAREPLLRNGANLEADDPDYWAAIAQFYPTLSGTAQQEVGHKLLKRLWLYSAWAHTADRSGNVRRALAFTSRDYWDVGSLSALGPLTQLIQGIVPTRPFGPALYYSVAVERATEAAGAIPASTGAWPGTYMQPAQLQQFLDGGGNTGYYVSDAALGALGSQPTAAPSAWVVLNAGAYLPANELQRLQAIAPVVTSAGDLAALPNQPLVFSSGLAGFGFFDQSGRRIVVASDPNTQAGSTGRSWTITLKGLTNPKYTVTDQFSGAVTSIAVANGVATLPVSIGRWDTQVLAIQ